MAPRTMESGSIAEKKGKAHSFGVTGLNILEIGLLIRYLPSCLLFFTVYFINLHYSDMEKEYSMLLMNPTNMLVIGPMIINMAKESSLITLVFMKVIGKMTKYVFSIYFLLIILNEGLIIIVLA